MFFVYFLRILSDLSFYYAFAGMFTAAHGGSIAGSFRSLLILSAGFAASCALSEKYERVPFDPSQAGNQGSPNPAGKARLHLSVLLPAAAAIFLALGTAGGVLPSGTAGSGRAADFAAALIASGYILFLLFTRRTAPVRDRLLPNMIVLAVLLVLILLYSMPGSRLQELCSSVGIPMAVLMGISSVMLLRILRLPESARSGMAFLLSNTAMTIVPLAAAGILASRQVRTALAAGLSFLWSKIAVPVLMVILLGFYWVFYGITWVISAVFFRNAAEEKPQIEDVWQNVLSEEEIEKLQGYSGSSLMLDVLRRLLPVLLIAAGIFFLYFFLSRGRRSSGREPAWRTLGEEPARAVKRPKRSAAAGSAARDSERVRAEYRKYLKYCRRKGIPIAKCDTSADIARRTAAADPANRHLPDQAEELRQIYIRARYDGTAGKEDVRRAGELVREIRSGTDADA